MTKIERESLESFAQSWGLAYIWSDRGSAIEFLGESGKCSFAEFWDAMEYLVAISGTKPDLSNQS